MAKLRWAAPYVSESRRGASPTSRCAQSRRHCALVRDAEGGFELAQIPAEGIVVTLSAEDGAILALNGGFTGLNGSTAPSGAASGSTSGPSSTRRIRRGFHPGSIVLDARSCRRSGTSGARRARQHLLRPDAAARGDGDLAQSGIGAHPGCDRPAITLHRGFSFPPGPAGRACRWRWAPIGAAAGHRARRGVRRGGFLVEPHVLAQVEDRHGTVVTRRAPRACRVPGASRSMPAATWPASISAAAPAGSSGGEESAANCCWRRVQ